MVAILKIIKSVAFNCSCCFLFLLSSKIKLAVKGEIVAHKRLLLQFAKSCFIASNVLTCCSSLSFKDSPMTALSIANASPVETLSTIASKLPGYGSVDIIYPNDWIGDWVVTEVVTSFEEQAPNSKLKFEQLPLLVRSEKSLINRPVEYTVQFLEDKNGVVNNRAYSLAAEYTAKLGTPAVAFWQTNYPNVAKLELPLQKLTTDVLISKRSTEKLQTSVEKAVGYSEFYRITEESTTKSQLPSAPKVLSRICS